MKHGWYDEFGKKTHYRDDVIHSDDGPAVIWPNGDLMWYRGGSVHRDNGPAVEWTNGYLAWYRHGIRHREDGPAQIRPDGEELFFLNGKQIDPVQFFVNQKITETEETA